MTARQCIFPWFDSMLGQESHVMTLNLFKPEVIKAKGYAADRVCGGQDKAVAYRTWLKFHAALSPSNWSY